MPNREKKKPDLDLEPKLKIKRLNRLAILLVAAVGILVLWVIYFALNTQPRVSGQAQKTRPMLQGERLALDRLEQMARENAEPPPSPVHALNLQPSASPPSPEFRRALQRLAIAHDAKVVPSGFDVRPRQSGEPDEPDELKLEPLPNLETPVASAAIPNPPPATPIAEPASPWSLQQGTLIPAILSAGIHSELPGQTTAIVRHDVFDTTTGQHLLIPQGSRLLGSYDHEVVWGQRRVLVAWNRILFPDGRSIQLGAMPGTDLAAMSGLHDQVNNHLVRTFGSALLLSAISAGTQLSQPQESADGGAPSARQVLSAAMGQELGRTATEVTRRNLDVRPTLVVRPGYLFHVEVTEDLELGSFLGE